MVARYRVSDSLYRENTRPRQLRGYLAYCGLGDILDQLADEVTTLRAVRAFESLVPAEIQRDCEIILFRDGTLCIHVCQPASANWLRNRQERIGQGLKERRVDIGRLTFVVSPRHARRSTGPAATLPPPPADAAHVLRQGARAINNPELRAALDRLANRLERSQP